MKTHAIVFASGVLLAAFTANAAPVYFSTSLTSAEVCSNKVAWSATKAPQPTELKVSVVNTPIVWKNFASERRRFGYNPSFVPGVVSIAPNGRVVIRDKNLNLQILRDDGTWKVVSLLAAARQSLQQQGYAWAPSPTVNVGLFGTAPEDDERVVFDQQCHAYTVVNAFRSTLGFAFLLHSRDGGRSWAAYPLPTLTGDDEVRMEAPSSTRHRLQQPPVMIVHEHPFEPFNIIHTAKLIFPEKSSDGSLVLPAPIALLDTVCCGSHSGIDTQVVTDGDLVHFAYPRATHEADPASGGRYGTAEYVITYRRSTRAVVSGPTLVGFGFDGPTGDAAVGNPHSQPALAMDSQGHLHVVIGGHGAEMKYRKSVLAHDSTQWSTPEYVSIAPHSDTYPSLVLDAQDQPHVVARATDASYRFKLVHRFRSSSTNAWSQQTVLLDPGRQYNSEWYHKLTIDPGGRLFISYSYLPANLWADEAAIFGGVWNFTLVKSDRSCRNFNVSQQSQEGAQYCEYSGYSDVSPGVLMSTDNGASFQLTTTIRFFVGGPNVDLYRSIAPLIPILSGN